MIGDVEVRETGGFDRFAVLAPPGCSLNHSCDPSAVRHGVVVFAWRPVEPGEEITSASTGGGLPGSDDGHVG